MEICFLFPSFIVTFVFHYYNHNYYLHFIITTHYCFYYYYYYYWPIMVLNATFLLKTVWYSSGYWTIIVAVLLWIVSLIKLILFFTCTCLLCLVSIMLSLIYRRENKKLKKHTWVCVSEYLIVCVMGEPGSIHLYLWDFHCRSCPMLPSLGRLHVHDSSLPVFWGHGGIVRCWQTPSGQLSFIRTCHVYGKVQMADWWYQLAMDQVFLIADP